MKEAYFQFWPNRILFYLSKTYTGQIRTGEDYDALKKCIHVSILDFIHFPKDKSCYRKITLCDTETGEQYTDLLEIHILELKKLSADEKKRLEYEARERAMLDYNTQIKSARNERRAEGEQDPGIMRRNAWTLLPSSPSQTQYVQPCFSSPDMRSTYRTD